MKHPITQHKISSFGEVLDYLKSGNKTILESIEFDISVRDNNGEKELEIGHPVDLRNRSEGTNAPEAKDFMENISQILTKQIVIDVKAKKWNPEKGQAEFEEGDVDYISKELPDLIETYLANTKSDSIPVEVIIASVHDDFLKEIIEKNIFPQKEIKTRIFWPEVNQELIEKAQGINIDEISLALPDDEENMREKLQELKDNGSVQNTELKFHIVDNPQKAKIIWEYFPKAEILTNESTLLEESKKEVQKEVQEEFTSGISLR